MRGFLLGVEDQHLVVKTRTRVPEPPRQIALESIELLESDAPREGGITAGKVIAYSLAGVGAFFLAAFLICVSGACGG